MVRSYRRPSEFELLGDNENDSLNTSLDTNTFNNEDDTPRSKKWDLIKVTIASVVAVMLLAGAVTLVLLYGTKKITEGGGEVNDALVDTSSLNITTKISVPTTLNPEKTNGNRERNPTTKTIETETKTSYASTIHKNESKTTPSTSEITVISTSPSSVAETTSILPTSIKITPSNNEAKTPLPITQITENLTSPSTEAKKTSISQSIEATTIPTSPTTIITTLQNTEVKTTSTSQAIPTLTLESTEIKTTSTSQATPTSTLESTEAKTTSTSQATTTSTSSSTQAIPTAQTTLSSTSASTQGISSTSEKTLSSTSPTTKSIPSTSLTILSSTPQREVETTTSSSTESNTSSQTTETPNVTTTPSPSSTTITSVISVQSTTPANFTTPTAFEPFTSVSTTPAGPRYPLPKSQIEVGTWYIIMSVFDGTVWDVYGGGLSNGAKIGLWPYLGQTNQHFRFDKIEYNQVTQIEARRSGKSVVYRSKAKLFQQWDNGFSSDGLWKVESVTNNAGVFQLRNEEFQKCASRKNTNLNSPDFLTLADCADRFTYFRLIPVCDGI